MITPDKPHIQLFLGAFGYPDRLPDTGGKKRFSYSFFPG